MILESALRWLISLVSLSGSVVPCVRNDGWWQKTLLPELLFADCARTVLCVGRVLVARQPRQLLLRVMRVPKRFVSWTDDGAMMRVFGLSVGCTERRGSQMTDFIKFWIPIDCIEHLKMYLVDTLGLFDPEQISCDFPKEEYWFFKSRTHDTCSGSIWLSVSTKGVQFNKHVFHEIMKSSSSPKVNICFCHQPWNRVAISYAQWFFFFLPKAFRFAYSSTSIQRPRFRIE